MSQKFKTYTRIAPLRRRIATLSAICRDADERTRLAREELWCLYAQEQLLESHDRRYSARRA